MRTVSIRTVAPRKRSPRSSARIRRLDADMPIADLKTQQQVVAGGVGYLMFPIGACRRRDGLRVCLSVVGVYGVVSYGASLRTREMGSRIPLGAQPRDVRGLVLRQGTVLVAAGIAAGLALAAIVTRTLSTFFVLVGTLDAPTFAAVTALLGGIALVACYLPARRAMRVDPMVALRHE